jgi:carbon starvation protein
MHRARYLWIPGLPLIWLVTVTFTAAWQKIFSPTPRIGFLAQAEQLEGMLRSGAVTGAPAAATQTLVFNARLDAIVCGIFLILVTVILVDSIRVWAGILRGTRKSELTEAPFVLSRLSVEEI